MSVLRHLALLSALALVAPDAAYGQPQWNQRGFGPGYGEGYERGQRAGIEDFRRGDSFQFADEGDYRRGDIGYRSQYGNRDRYREMFRRGFQDGYRSGYGNSAGPGYSGRGSLPPWSAGQGRGYGPVTRGYGSGIYDLAYQTGLNDGYEAGLDDGRDDRRFDPVGERRYRGADRGYRREYGPREAYKNNYREAFKQGYARGYADGRRYDRGPNWRGLFGFRF